MDTNLFCGKLVRFTAVDPQTLAETYVRWFRDAECWRLQDTYPPRPASSKKIKEWAEKDLERDHPDMIGFMISTLENDPLGGSRLLGDIALFGINWSHGEAFVGIGINEREFWGKGYGSDAMRLMLRYAFAELNLHRVALFVFEYNPRAVRSYEKVGFRHEGRVRGAMQREGRRWDSLFMGILRDEWQKTVNSNQ